MKELGRFAFKCVADELKDPSQQKQRERIHPQATHKKAGPKHRNREQNRRNAQRVAEPVHRMLMAGGILRDPLPARAVAQHAEESYTGNLIEGREPPYSKSKPGSSGPPAKEDAPPVVLYGWATMPLALSDFSYRELAF